MTCFWCGTEQLPTLKADLVPMGSNNASYAPCVECELTMGVGEAQHLSVTVVEVADCEVVEFQVGLHLGGGRVVYPTGSWAVVDRDYMKKFQDDLAELTGRYGFCMVSPEVWDLIGLTRLSSPQ